jgi:SAM-dependent methyltransferase
MLHLQCHFGRDTLTLAQRGAEITGVDFSAEAIRAAREIAAELKLSDRCHFAQANVYDAPEAVSGSGTFDRVFLTWGALNWLPDVNAWARVVAHFLKPGGALYLAEFHPIWEVLCPRGKIEEGLFPTAPYCSREPVIDANPRDYTGNAPRLSSGPIYEWVHPIGEVINALCDAGLIVRWVREHDVSPWSAWARQLQLRWKDGLWHWPEKSWLPLSYSLWAERR